MTILLSLAAGDLVAGRSNPVVEASDASLVGRDVEVVESHADHGGGEAEESDDLLCKSHLEIAMWKS